MSDVDFDYDQIPPGYYDTVARSGSGVRRYWHEYKFRYLMEQMDSIAELQGRPLKIVDVGCGPGTFLGALNDRFQIQGTGIDIAKPQIDYAQKTYARPNLQFIHAEASDPVVRESLKNADVVMLVEVVEHLHLRDAHELLTLLNESMKKGAHLFVTTPNYVSAWPALEQIVNFVSDVNYEEQHITKLNRRRLSSLLSSASFKDIQIRSFLHLSPFAVGLVGETLGSFTRVLENRFLTHGGPLLCARATK